MIIVALGLMIDAATPRPYVGDRVGERPRRELAMRVMLNRRSYATRRREAYRQVSMHRRSDRVPTRGVVMYSPYAA